MIKQGLDKISGAGFFVATHAKSGVHFGRR